LACFLLDRLDESLDLCVCGSLGCIKCNAADLAVLKDSVSIIKTTRPVLNCTRKLCGWRRRRIRSAAFRTSSPVMSRTVVFELPLHNPGRPGESTPD
jgi:hypothetical protein